MHQVTTSFIVSDKNGRRVKVDSISVCSLAEPHEFVVEHGNLHPSPRLVCRICFCQHSFDSFSTQRSLMGAGRRCCIEHSNLWLFGQRTVGQSLDQFLESPCSPRNMPTSSHMYHPLRRVLLVCCPSPTMICTCGDGKGSAKTTGRFLFLHGRLQIDDDVGRSAPTNPWTTILDLVDESAPPAVSVSISSTNSNITIFRISDGQFFPNCRVSQKRSVATARY